MVTLLSEALPMNNKKGRQLRLVPNKYPLPGQVHDLHKAIAKDAILGIYW